MRLERRNRRHDVENSPVAGRRVPTHEREEISTLRCPNCQEALISYRWQPATISRLRCLHGCGTYRRRYDARQSGRAIAGHNPTNAVTIVGRITQLGPTYGRVNSIQRGGLIKLGVSIDF